MPNLSAPSRFVFFLSLIFAVIAVISYFTHMPYFGEHPSILMTLAYVVLAVGCVMKGV